ncbi:MAG: hypothetical protein M3R55_02215, partial [Acidobacteriota bacterium]|nr:hypothetical protein [Acidobacteriota bacterium]
MIARLFHGWERRLASITTDRIVRPFDWGLDWVDMPADAAAATPPADGERLRAWAREAMRDSDRFYHVEPADTYEFDGHHLRYE